ncbi:MAG TPA: alpha/beta fold hydrolase [Pseudonocardiaceae bacterium]|nr:alpha/beta fold hydrolase [Pseudonocardiaceae bacterium]
MDERLASAIAHWAPRFTTNGVTAGDFERITGSIDAWSEWCHAWSAVAAEHEALGDEAQDNKRMRSAGAHYAQAATYYHFAKFVFVEDLDQMRQAHTSAVRCLMRALPHLDPPGERVEIPFEGSHIVGVLRLPAGPGPHPAVVLIPGLDSTKEEFRSTEELFLLRGLATLSVDGPGQGEAEYDLPIRGDWEVPGAAVLDWICARPEIAADRVAIWGVSLGGYYAPRIASGDSRVKACVALCGPYNFGEVWGGLPELTRETFRVRSRSATDDEARRAALALGMAGRTELITCPLLVVAGKRDRLIPWQDAQRLADEVAGAKLLAIDIGNHGCANVAPMHRYRTADWVAEQLA